MNTAPAASVSSASATDMGAAGNGVAAASIDGDLFALLLGNLVLTPMEAQPRSAGAEPGLEAETDSEGDFSLLLSQLPGFDGLGIQPTPVLGAGLLLNADASAGGAAAVVGGIAQQQAEALALDDGASGAALFDEAVLANAIDGAAEGELPARSLGAAVAQALGERTALVDAPEHATTVHAFDGIDAAGAPEMELVLPPGSAPKVAQAFSDGMAMRLGWMAGQKIGRAEIELHPSELGSIDISLEFDGNAVRAEFNSSNAEVRQLIESTLPRLRDLLEAQGMQLRDANVGDHGSSRQRNDGLRDGGLLAGGATLRPETTTDSSAPRRQPLHRGGLSEYA